MRLNVEAINFSIGNLGKRCHPAATRFASSRNTTLTQMSDMDDNLSEADNHDADNQVSSASQLISLD